MRKGVAAESVPIGILYPFPWVLEVRSVALGMMTSKTCFGDLLEDAVSIASILVCNAASRDSRSALIFFITSILAAWCLFSATQALFYLVTDLSLI